MTALTTTEAGRKGGSVLPPSGKKKSVPPFGANSKQLILNNLSDEKRCNLEDDESFVLEEQKWMPERNMATPNH